MAVAAIDFGRKRIGLAITDADGRGAYPVGIVERRSLKEDLDAIRSQLAERRVSRIVVGLPLNMDGTEGPSARAARAFAEHLGTATGVAIEMFDERLTSVEAEERLRSASMEVYFPGDPEARRQPPVPAPPRVLPGAPDPARLRRPAARAVHPELLLGPGRRYRRSKRREG